MDGIVSRGDDFDVSDSTDWLLTPLAAIVPVEANLRCHVCKDFFDSPMLTSCCHTFCSLCIRRALAVDGRCPVCRMTDQESKLRGNWALRDAVAAFVASRPAILGFARAVRAQSATRGANQAPSSPKRRAAQEEPDDGPESKRPRRSARATKAKAVEETADTMWEEANIPEDNSEAEFEPDDGLVACPICWKRMKEQQVDKHMDTSCPGERQSPTRSLRSRESLRILPKSSIASATAPATPVPERLAPLHYSLIKDAALRKKMAELQLSTHGNRQLLEKRHKEWVTIWNANCDSARPKKRSELLRDLDVWERTIGNQAPSRITALGEQIRDKDFDGAAWAQKHNSSFQDLIAEARKTRMQAQAQAEKTEREEAVPTLEVRKNETDGGSTGGLPGEIGPLLGQLPEYAVIDLTGASSQGVEVSRRDTIAPLPSGSTHAVSELARVPGENPHIPHPFENVVSSSSATNDLSRL